MRSAQEIAQRAAGDLVHGEGIAFEFGDRVKIVAARLSNDEAAPAIVTQLGNNRALPFSSPEQRRSVTLRIARVRSQQSSPARLAVMRREADDGRVSRRGTGHRRGSTISVRSRARPWERFRGLKPTAEGFRDLRTLGTPDPLLLVDRLDAQFARLIEF